jgi:hypothetical protein
LAFFVKNSSVLHSFAVTVILSAQRGDLSLEKYNTTSSMRRL